MHRERLRTVADLIESRPDHFDMTVFMHDKVTGAFSVSANEMLHGCGTIGCVAGWAATAASIENDHDRPLGYDDVPNIAASYLRLTNAEAMQLFLPDRLGTVWHELFGPEYEPFKATAADAARLLRSLADGETTFPPYYDV